MKQKFDHLRIETPRLILRQWKESDLRPFAEMNADPEVMKYFLKPLTEEESNAMVEKCSQRLAEDKFGYWAVEEKETCDFLGFVALQRVPFECPVKGQIEIGWRLKGSAWGKGFASEGAKKLLEYGFSHLGFDEIVSITAKVNERSQKVMERIGMKRRQEDNFDHIKIPEENPLRPHVIYRIGK